MERASKAWCWYCNEVMYFAPDDVLLTTDADHPKIARVLNPDADEDHQALVHMRCHLDASEAERLDALARIAQTIVDGN